MKFSTRSRSPVFVMELTAAAGEERFRPTGSDKRSGSFVPVLGFFRAFTAFRHYVFDCKLSSAGEAYWDVSHFCSLGGSGKSECRRHRESC